jgi:hypothetical protein
MPRLQTIRIESILGGQSDLANFAREDQFRASMGIDPAQPIDDDDSATSSVASGFLRPAASEKFSGTTITAAPLWMTTNPKDTNVYVYDALGSAYTIDPTFATVKWTRILRQLRLLRPQHYDRTLRPARRHTWIHG